MFLHIEEVESRQFEGQGCRPGNLDGVILDKCTCIRDNEIRNNFNKGTLCLKIAM